MKLRKAPTWQNNILLEGFSPEELAEIASLAQDLHFEKHDQIVKEGSPGEQFFFIASGSLEVIKENRRISVLGAGDVVGELAILGCSPRIATVRALEPTVVKEVIIKTLSPWVIDKLAKNLSYLFSTRLSAADQATAEALQREFSHMQKRGAMSAIAAKSIIGLALYELIARQMIKYLHGYYFPIFSCLYLTWVAFYLCRDVKRQGYPLSMFGLTFRNWKRSISETLLFMLPLLLLSLILKQALILTSADYAGQTLFRFALEAHATSFEEHLLLAISFVLYILFSPIQELIFRGILQTSWQRFSSGSHRTLLAIIITSVLYFTAHFYWSLSFLVLIPSFLWGWLFARHRTLVGVSIGHILLGVWIFWIVGLSF